MKHGLRYRWFHEARNQVMSNHITTPKTLIVIRPTTVQERNVLRDLRYSY
jgi:hypothetical protein